MAEIEPAPTWEPVVSKIQREVSIRRTYRRSGGKPCPTPLATVQTKRHALDRIELALQVQVNRELAAEALQAMERIYVAHVAAISNTKRKQEASRA